MTTINDKEQIDLNKTFEDIIYKSKTFENSNQTKIENEEKNTLPESIKEDAKTKENTAIKEDVKVDHDYETLQKQHETLQKQLKDSKSWAHKKNKAYINAKKNLTEFLGKQLNEYIITEEDYHSALKYFDEPDEDETIETQEKNTFVSLKDKIDKEFSIYKKYNKTNQNLEKNYQAFFTFLPLLDPKEQQKVINYIETEDPEIVLDSILISGSEIYDNILKGTEEKGGMIPFVKSLNETIEKQNKIIKELEEELNHKTGKVSSRSIKSNNVKEIESSKNNNENLNEWFKNRLQGR